MTEHVTLTYNNWGEMEETTGMKVELPLAFWFLDKFDDEVVEIGEVTDLYIDSRHTVYSLKATRPTTIVRDPLYIDYTDSNVLSVTSWFLDNEGGRAFNLLSKITAEANNWLLTFPININVELQEKIIEDGYKLYLLEKDKQNNWTQVDSNTDLNKYKLREAVMVVTNLDVSFAFNEMKKEPIYVDPDLRTIKELKEDELWPYSFTSTVGLVPYIKRAGQDLVGVEIGTCRGESAYLLLERCPNIKLLYTIDPYVEFDDWNGTVPTEVLAKQKKLAIENLSDWGSRVNLILRKSEEAVTEFEDDSLDFVYIDGDHSYDGVTKDLTLYYPKLKKGGYLCGHDFDTLGSVKQAVMDFRSEKRIRSPINLTNNSSFFWIK